MRTIAAIAGVVLASLLSSCGRGGGGYETPSPAISPSGAISGRQLVLAASDVNAPDAPFATNDTAATAQPIPNPVTVAGFASITGSGPAGSRFASVPDQFDTYRVNLAAGQLVTLAVSQWN